MVEDKQDANMVEEVDLYLFMAVFGDEKSAEPVAKAIASAAKTNAVTVDGLAAVHRDTHGRVRLHEIGDITGSQGAVRGAAAGAALALLFPPSILVTSVIGGVIGSVIAKFHDTGFATKDLHALGESLEKGESAVIFIGDSKTEVSLSDELDSARKVEKHAAPPDLKEEIDESVGGEHAETDTSTEN